MAQTLYVAISGHGYGHVGQTAPVVNELARRRPELRVVVHSPAPPALLEGHFHCSFEPIREPTDLGMANSNPLDVSAEDSHASYQAVHNEWENRVALEVERLEAHRPDLVLANVPYLCAVAAAQAGIPVVMMGSLNWAEIYHAYCSQLPGADAIYRQMLEAYSQAERFLQVTPCMPMPGLSNTQRIGPVARSGRNRREELVQTLGLNAGDRLVAASLGGIPGRVDTEAWPRIQGIHWLVTGLDLLSRPDLTDIETLGVPFIDVMYSCDGLLTKPGYGSIVEAVCNGIPVLYISRGDWPEEPYLVEWMDRYGCCLELHREDFEQGRLQDPLLALFAQPRRPPVAAGGIYDAVKILESYL